MHTNRPAHELAITTTPDVETFNVTDVDIQVVGQPRPHQFTIFPWDEHDTTKTSIVIELRDQHTPTVIKERIVFYRQHVIWTAARDRVLTRKTVNAVRQES